MIPLWRRLRLPPPHSEASGGKLSLKDNEVYSGIIVPRLPCFVRLDGWKFHGLSTALGLEHPFDRFFAESMVAVARRLMERFDAALGYVFSDEINLLFLKRPGFERVEKIDSVFAGLASSLLSARLAEEKERMPELAFDCRVIPVEEGDIRKYLIWRQAEAWRNCCNALAYWALRAEGLGAAEATKKLEGLGAKRLRALARRKGGGKPEPWQERGVVLHWERFKKAGFDPIKGKAVLAERRRVKEEWEPPLFAGKQGKAFIERMLREASR
ncbi:MAG: tRNA(His) guanylyltransferase Thg1 family protein [Candidatus Micrarchaeia archaeon]